MEKQLKVNENPVVRAYTYHAFPLSVLSASDYVGDMKLSIWSEEFLTEDFVEAVNSEYRIDGNNIKVFAHEYAADVRFKVSLEDQFILGFEHLQYTQPLSYVKVTYSDTVNREKYGFYKIFQNGTIENDGFTDDNKDVELENVKAITSEKNCGRYILSIETDEILKTIYIEDKSNNMTKVELEIYFGDNQYYNWLFSNYIQLFGRNVFDKEYFLDYYIAPEKDREIFYTIHPLIEFFHQEKRILDMCNVDYIKYVKANIDDGNYAEVELNQKYIKSSGYTNDYIHQTLIYGYSDEKKEFLIEIIGTNGIMSCTTISYEDFYKAIGNSEERIVYLKVRSQNKKFELDVSCIKRTIEDYLAGTDWGLRYDYLLPKDKIKDVLQDYDKEAGCIPRLPNVFGIDIYQYFCDKGVLFDYFLHDLRIIYMIKEHKMIMCERIKFLYYRGKISSGKYEELYESAEKLKKIAETIQNYAIKNNVVHNMKYVQRIAELLLVIRDGEKAFLEALLNEL